MTVYLDGVMGLNFVVDWLLLLGVNRLTGFPPGLGRTAAAAALGSGYAGACLIPGLRFLGSGLWRIVSLGLISVAAFGVGRSGLRRGVLFLLLSMALAGLAVRLRVWGGAGIPGCAGALGLLCRMGFRGRAGAGRLVPVILRHGEKTVSVTALEDTGNALRDPLTGEPVVVADRKTAFSLLGLSREALENPETTLQSQPMGGFRLIPFRTVGQASGFLLALRCREVYVDGRPTGGLVAFSPVDLGNGDYSALTGG